MLCNSFPGATAWAGGDEIRFRNEAKRGLVPTQRWAMHEGHNFSLDDGVQLTGDKCLGFVRTYVLAEEVVDCWRRIAHVLVKPYRRKHVWSAAGLASSLPRYPCGLLRFFELLEEQIVVLKLVVADLAINQGGPARDLY